MAPVGPVVAVLLLTGVGFGGLGVNFGPNSLWVRCLSAISMEDEVDELKYLFLPMPLAKLTANKWLFRVKRSHPKIQGKLASYRPLLGSVFQTNLSHNEPMGVKARPKRNYNLFVIDPSINVCCLRRTSNHKIARKYPPQYSKHFGRNSPNLLTICDLIFQRISNEFHKLQAGRSETENCNETCSLLRVIYIFALIYLLCCFYDIISPASFYYEEWKWNLIETLILHCRDVCKNKIFYDS